MAATLSPMISESFDRWPPSCLQDDNLPAQQCHHQGGVSITRQRWWWCDNAQAREPMAISFFAECKYKTASLTQPPNNNNTQHSVVVVIFVQCLNHPSVINNTNNPFSPFTQQAWETSVEIGIFMDIELIWTPGVLRLSRNLLLATYRIGECSQNFHPWPRGMPVWWLNSKRILIHHDYSRFCRLNCLWLGPVNQCLIGSANRNFETIGTPD